MGETVVSVTCPVVLESNVPGVNVLWTKHEQRWALKCGHALASWCFLVILAVVAIFTATSRKIEGSSRAP